MNTIQKRLQAKIAKLTKELSYAKVSKKTKARLAGKVLRLIQSEAELEQIAKMQIKQIKTKSIKWEKDGKFLLDLNINTIDIIKQSNVITDYTITIHHYGNKYFVFGEDHNPDEMHPEYDYNVKFEKVNSKRTYSGQPYFVRLKEAKLFAEDFAMYMVSCIIENIQEDMYINDPDEPLCSSDAHDRYVQGERIWMELVG
jgi:hypothetical protein